jgi:hypothetical protein
MRRWIWLLGLLVVGIAGTVWWSSRNAVRLEPLDAQRFAQMNETEQVEWLIEQVLARSKRTGMLTDIANNLPFVRPTEWQPLLPRHIRSHRNGVRGVRPAPLAQFRPTVYAPRD